MFDITDMPLFAGLDQRTLADIRNLSTGLQLSAGTSIGQQGGLGRECVLVCSGTVAVERDGETVAELGAGSVFGEVALLSGSGSLRTASGRTLTECDVLVFSKAEFAELLDRAPTVAERIERLAISRLRSVLDADSRRSRAS